MVAIVAFAATGRRAAAVLAAVSAAVGFNLFHTEPYLSLRINSSDDVETAVLLLAVGLAVGELAVRGRRRGAVAERAPGPRDPQGLGALVAEGEDADYVLLATASELTHLLGLVDCRFEATPRTTRSCRSSTATARSAGARTPGRPSAGGSPPTAPSSPCGRAAHGGGGSC